MESTTIAGGGRAANTAGNENDVQDVAKDRLRDANGVTVNLPLQGEATQQQCVDHCVSHSVQSMDSHMIHEQASVEVREEACDLGHSDDLDRADDTAYEDSKEDDGVPFDRGWAWMVVLGCCINFALLSGYAKSNGVFFVELLSYFQSTASHTSLLFAVKGTFYSILGLFVMNIMVGRIGCRKTVLIGAVLMSLSAILASVCNDLTLLIFVQAILLGAGDVMVISPGEVLIAAYFKRHRSLAIALAKCGSSIGSVALPPLVTFLLAEYGLKGAYLLTGAVCLHALPAALLLRPTSYFRKRRAQRRSMMQCRDGADSAVGLSEFKKTTNKQQEQLLGSRPTDSQQDGVVFKLSDSTSPNGNNDGSCVCAARGLPISMYKKTFPELGEDGAEDARHVTAANETRASTKLLQHHDVGQCFVTKQHVSAENRPPLALSFICRQAVFSRLKAALFALDFSLFRRPTFRLLFACFVFFPCVNIAVEYLPVLAKENHATEAQAATLLSIIGALDLVCRLGSGLIANTGRVTPATLVQVTFLVLGITYHLVRYLTSYHQLLVLAVLQGLQGGTVNCMIPMLIVDTVGVQHMAKGIGFYQLAAGSFITAAHPLLGYVRDRTGTYVTVYHVIGSCLLLTALLMCFTKPLQRLERRRCSESLCSVQDSVIVVEG